MRDLEIAVDKCENRWFVTVPAVSMIPRIFDTQEIYNLADKFRRTQEDKENHAPQHLLDLMKDRGGTLFMLFAFTGNSEAGKYWRDKMLNCLSRGGAIKATAFAYATETTSDSSLRYSRREMMGRLN
jgi:hypothetical protein